jgi:hypothetical protein
MEDLPRAFTLTFPFSLWDRLRAAFVLVPQSKPSLAAAVLFPLLALAYFSFTLNGIRPFDGKTAILLAIFLLFYPLVLTITVFATHFGNPQAREPFTYTFDDRGIHVSAMSYEFTHRWSAISRITRRGGYLLLFFSRSCAHTIPVRFVEQAGVIGPLLALAKDNGVATEGV